jgi:hypothetical protein
VTPEEFELMPEPSAPAIFKSILLIPEAGLDAMPEKENFLSILEFINI